MRRITLCVLFLAVSSSAVHAQLRDVLVAKSPEGDVQIRFLPGEPRLRFTVIMNGTTIIEPSPIAFTVDGVDLAEGVTATPVRQNYAVNEEYPARGVHALAVNYCNGVRQTLKHAASGQEYTLDLRAYRDGVAFRFVVPGAAGQQRVPEETTTFTVPAGTTVWSHNLRGHYEGTYEKRDVGALETGTWHAPPVTFKVPGGTYAAITEAALVNYSGMALEADGQRGFRIGLAHRQPVSHPYELRYSKEDVARLSKPAVIDGTITTPWRVVMLAGDLNALVNSDLVPNLSPPPDKTLFPLGPLTPWVLPGRAVWRYLDNEVETAGDPGADPPATRGATRPTTRPTTGPGTEPPAGPAPGDTIPAPVSGVVRPRGDAVAIAVLAEGVGVAAVGQLSAPPAEAGSPTGAATRGATTTTTRATTTTTTTTTTSTSPASRPRTTAKEMKQWSELAAKLGFQYSILEGFWSRWPAEELKDLVESSRLQGVGIWVWVHSRNLRSPEQRAELFKKCVDAGVVGLKVDFFDHEHKETIDQYHAILKGAAEHKLLLNFHGANKPTGGSRTWPNELVREAVRGMESRLKERAFHHTTLPFTRFLAGHAEYTTVMFDTLRRGDTTFAHQIATPIVFTAPLHTFAAHPKNLLASPAVDLIRLVPPVWDETIVLPPSEISEIAVFARRLKDTWFLGVLNGTAARQIKVPLSFLKGGKYTAILVRDGTTPETMTVEKDVPSALGDTLTIDLAAGGGFAGCFTKKEE